MSDHVRLEAVKHIRVHRNGELVADTLHGYVIHEGGLSDRYYIPRSDIKATLSDGSGGATCPWKGDWKHLDVTIGNTKVPDGAWTYFAPTKVCEPVRDFDAFYDSKFQTDYNL